MMTILVVENNPLARKLLETAIVKEHGRKCLAASDGQQAWQMFQDSDIDVVICERDVTGIDGVELCAKVRNHPKDSYTYFVVLVPSSGTDDLVLAMQAGADTCLAKPVEPEALEAVLIPADRVTRLSQVPSKAEQEASASQQWMRKDPLTGLNNSLQLEEDLEDFCARVERYGHTYCLALLDVDALELYNDTYGYWVGNSVLRAIGKVLAKHHRSGDSLYRLSGGEFVVVLPEQSLESATLAAERLRDAVEDLAISHPGAPAQVVTISAGVVALPAEFRVTSDQVLREARTALQSAKVSGRNCVIAA